MLNMMMMKKKTTPSSLIPPISLTLVLALSLNLCGASVSRCPEGHYRERHSALCLACSTCPVNQIIRSPCTDDTNTLCGPFSEFYEFHQAPRPRVDVDDLPPLLPEGQGPPGVGRTEDDTRESDDNRSRKVQEGRYRSGGDADRSQQKHSKHQRGGGSGKWQQRHRNGEDLTPPASEDLLQGSDSAPAGRGGPGGQPEAPSLQNPEEGQNQWKVLALALIVVLCIVCIFLIVFVFVICYMRSRRAHLKQVLYSAEHAGSGGAGSHSSGRGGGPASHRPFHSLHYVPVLTHAQPRAGTSGGAMVAPHGGLVDSSYLYSEEYDADNSGQTISTTKSSDYVYFKSPHNGNEVYDV